MHLNLILGINHCNADLILKCIKASAERQLNIFGTESFDVEFLLENYILPRIDLQNKLDAVKIDIAALNDNIKNF